MDKDLARAVGLALAVFTYNGTPGFLWRDIFMCADKYEKYITLGVWPKEAVDQIGKVKEVSEA